MHSGMICVVLTLALVGARVEGAGAQAAAEPAGAPVSGVVYDSLTGTPLADALVQLVDLRRPMAGVRSARTSVRGLYVLEGVPDGQYQIGFLHPVLDSLGITLKGQAVAIERSRPVIVDLSVPSATRLREAYCGPRATAGTGAVLVGVVRRATDHAPVAGARVETEWVEYVITSERITRDVAHRNTMAGPAGWFAFCDAPRGGRLVVRADHGADSSGRVEIEMPELGFLRRDLLVGGRGDGRLRGVVVAVQGGGPVAGAVVGIPDGGPEVRTDADGRWVLAGLPTGTQTLEVRAIGYQPRRGPVDVVSGSAPVTVELSTMRAVLDTVRVRASRLRLAGTGFDQRAQGGAGRYITAEHIARSRPGMTSDLLRMVPGLRFERSTIGETLLTVRGPAGQCSAAVYIDGHHVPGLSVEDIDSWAQPDAVAGIEIYSGAFVPPEFQDGRSGCGSIVIWTKPFDNPARRWSWTRRAAQGVGAILLGAGVGVLLTRM